MKMNYLQRNNDKRFTKKNIKKILILTFVLIFFNYLLGSNFKNLLYSFKNPQTDIYQKIDGVYKNISNIFTNKNYLISENENLRMQIEELEDNIKSLKETEYRYKEIMDISSSSDKYIYKEIVTKPPFSPFDILIIKTADQIHLKSLVFYKDTLIGQVSKMDSGLAQIDMFSSSKTEHNFYIERTSNPVSVFGMGAGNFYAKVPKDFDIKNGDILVNDLSLRYKIAKVLNVDSDPNMSFKDVYFKIPVSLYSISFVNILK